MDTARTAVITAPIRHSVFTELDRQPFGHRIAIWHSQAGLVVAWLPLVAMREATTSGDLSDGDLVEVASVNDPVEGEMIRGLLQNDGIPSVLQPVGINGPLLGIGLLPQGAQRVMVRASQADPARSLLGETMAGSDMEVDELANASYLDDAKGRGPRSYGLVGAYVRIWLWSFAALGVAFGVFLLARAI